MDYSFDLLGYRPTNIQFDSKHGRDGPFCVFDTRLCGLGYIGSVSRRNKGDGYIYKNAMLKTVGTAGSRREAGAKLWLTKVESLGTPRGYVLYSNADLVRFAHYLTEGNEGPNTCPLAFAARMRELKVMERPELIDELIKLVLDRK